MRAGACSGPRSRLPSRRGKAHPISPSKRCIEIVKTTGLRAPRESESRCQARRTRRNKEVGHAQARHHGGRLLLGGAAVGVIVYVETDPRAFTTLEPRLGAGVESVTKAVREIRSTEVEPPALTLDEITVWGVAHRLEKVGPASLPIAALRPCSDWWQLDPQSNVRMLCQ
jgi:hypothetical protein